MSSGWRKTRLRDRAFVRVSMVASTAAGERQEGGMATTTAKLVAVEAGVAGSPGTWRGDVVFRT
jgi:hypothetical protein